MLSFRQKIFISYVLAFIIFLLLLFPLASLLVKRIVTSAMENRSRELIARLIHAPNNEALVRTLKDQKALIFFRVSVITDDLKVLYDSHTKRLLGPRFSQEYITDHPEVEEAFRDGIGYHEDWSDLLGQKFAYLATAFNFHGKRYVLRTAFPYRYVYEIQSDFELGFLALATTVLLLFSVMSWIIINHFTQPIQTIISAVTPYQKGKTNTLPSIELSNVNPNDDFGKLALTLNSLTSQVQDQINSLETAANEKDLLLESLVEGVIAIDPEMKVIYANQSALKILHMQKNDLIGRDFSHSGLEKGKNLLSECLKKKKALSDTLELETESGKYYLNMIAAPKVDSGALLVLEDKTKDVKILEMRKEFIANASHELKTPITIIQGFAETLHDNPELPKSVMEDVTTKIVNSCRRMTSLIKNLLALADIEHLPDFRVSHFNIIPAIDKCIQMTKEVFKEADISLKAPDAVEIEGDPDLIEMAIHNLINNAAKYSLAPIVIKITVEVIEKSVKISVKDSGIGIPEKDLNKIFERFYRVDKIQSKKMGGSGLGLSIVHTIVQKHNGKISVSSKVNEGSTFTIWLPLKFTSRP